MRVTDVLLNFRSALLAVIPYAERFGIPWRRPDAYDEWDAIASVLFSSLVVRVLRCILPESRREEFSLPSYDLLVPHYARYRIQVVNPALPSGIWVFHAFGTSGEALDVVEVREIDEKGKPLSERLAMCPVSGSVFQLHMEGSHKALEEFHLATD